MRDRTCAGSVKNVGIAERTSGRLRSGRRGGVSPLRQRNPYLEGNRSRTLPRLGQRLGSVLLAKVEAVPRRHWLWWSVAMYGVLALFAYAPLWPGDPHAIMNCVCGDNVQAPWFLGYVPWAILHGHNPFFTTYLDYPRGANLITNTSVPLLGVLAAPVTELFGAIASFNLLMFLAFPPVSYTHLTLPTIYSV